MDYEKFEKDNYNVYLIKTKKFKTVYISAVFRRENDVYDEIYSSLLTRVLPLATKKYHDLDELCKAGARIYDPSFKFNVTCSGRERVLNFKSIFANERYTEIGMNAKSIDFVFDYFWNPYVDDEGFDSKIFDVCKHEYIEGLRAIKDNPDRYTAERVWEEMEVYPFRALSISESIDEAEKITREDLFKYYKSIFENDCLDIFVAGDVDEKIIASIDDRVKGNFKKSYKNRFIVQNNVQNKEIIEENNNTQSKLAIGLKYDELSDFERKYVSLVYNNLLGGGWNSKLNKVVREKNSLCYYIYANRQTMFGVSFIYSGIDASNYKRVVSLILEQMKEVEDGIFEEVEIASIKNTYKNALIEIEDNQDSIMGNIILSIISDTDDVNTRRMMIDKVKASDIKKFAKKVHIDTIYLLKGGSGDE